MELHDFGTTFKAYRAEILKDINLYGELHRFIPALAGLYGARVAEVPIRNVPRAAGESHYGLSRTFNVLLDILTIRFLNTSPAPCTSSAGQACWEPCWEESFWGASRSPS